MSQELNEGICKAYRQKRQYLRELNIFNDLTCKESLVGSCSKNATFLKSGH